MKIFAYDTETTSLPDTAMTSAVPHNALEDARALARGAVG